MIRSRMAPWALPSAYSPAGVAQTAAPNAGRADEPIGRRRGVRVLRSGPLMAYAGDREAGRNTQNLGSQVAEIVAVDLRNYGLSRDGPSGLAGKHPQVTRRIMPIRETGAQNLGKGFVRPMPTNAHSRCFYESRPATARPQG